MQDGCHVHRPNRLYKPLSTTSISHTLREGRLSGRECPSNTIITNTNSILTQRRRNEHWHTLQQSSSSGPRCADISPPFSHLTIDLQQLQLIVVVRTASLPLPGISKSICSISKCFLWRTSSMWVARNRLREKGRGARSWSRIRLTWLRVRSLGIVRVRRRWLNIVRIISGHNGQTRHRRPKGFSDIVTEIYTLFHLFPNTIYIQKHNGIILELRLRAEPQIP